MFADRDRLHIAIQKSGRLSESSRELLRGAGLKIQDGKNQLTARVANLPIDLMFVRDDDIPTFVSDGVCEFGIVGSNVLEEFALRDGAPGFEVVAPLGFGRCSLKIAAPEDLPHEGPASLAGARIATSYPRLLKRWLTSQSVEAQIVKMNGAVELAPRLQIASHVCDIVSTGATLEANGLRVVESVFDSEAVLVRSRKAVTAEQEALSDNLLRRIEGVLATQDSKYILMNAPGEALNEIARILPAPTARPSCPCTAARASSPSTPSAANRYSGRRCTR
jgi:ATP phosphoribosyltransferase